MIDEIRKALIVKPFDPVRGGQSPSDFDWALRMIRTLGSIPVALVKMAVTSRVRSFSKACRSRIDGGSGRLTIEDSRFWILDRGRERFGRATGKRGWAKCGCRGYWLVACGDRFVGCAAVFGFLGHERWSGCGSPPSRPASGRGSCDFALRNPPDWFCLSGLSGAVEVRQANPARP